jgi:hypothetical protein
MKLGANNKFQKLPSLSQCLEKNILPRNSLHIKDLFVAASTKNANFEHMSRERKRAVTQVYSSVNQKKQGTKPGVKV